MRIQEVNTGKLMTTSIEEKNKYSIGNQRFDELVEKESKQIRDDRLNEMLLDLDNISQKLKQNLTLENLLLYKKKVRQFLQDTTSRMFRREKREYTDLTGRKRIYTLIEKINARLEEMTKEFIQDNSKNIDLLKMIDDIRGMLIDMYL
ncbi:YaaR family protein [Aceticella autotrophica]|uniref:YaaR family protein n=1 Tax=Aceticella autotrophica TaxID=2755338 RepID=A0A975AVW8_9THEO|nr:YaaR family protein [Aceticella autotrophica]QSZ27420.1 YaaR family protein [Aceticella autotrophica]